jgi:hypothetical protein
MYAIIACRPLIGSARAHRTLSNLRAACASLRSTQGPLGRPATCRSSRCLLPAASCPLRLLVIASRAVPSLSGPHLALTPSCSIASVPPDAPLLHHRLQSHTRSPLAYTTIAPLLLPCPTVTPLAVVPARPLLHRRSPSPVCRPLVSQACNNQPQAEPLGSARRPLARLFARSPVVLPLVTCFPASQACNNQPQAEPLGSARSSVLPPARRATISQKLSRLVPLVPLRSSCSRCASCSAFLTLHLCSLCHSLPCS